MKKDLLKIINHYGIRNQLKYIHSEYFELDEAIIQYEEGKRNPVDIVLNCMEPILAEMNNREASIPTKHITEEIADIIVMLKQIQYYYGITDDEIRNVMQEKIDRQLRRIEEEK